jgi:hypothetical protein
VLGEFCCLGPRLKKHFINASGGSSLILASGVGMLLADERTLAAR